MKTSAPRRRWEDCLRPADQTRDRWRREAWAARGCQVLPRQGQSRREEALGGAGGDERVLEDSLALGCTA